MHCSNFTTGSKTGIYVNMCGNQGNSVRLPAPAAADVSKPVLGKSTRMKYSWNWIKAYKWQITGIYINL